MFPDSEATTEALRLMLVGEPQVPIRMNGSRLIFLHLHG